MDKGELYVLAIFIVHNRSGKFFLNKFFRFFFFFFVLFFSAHFPINGAQHSVDEFSGRIAAESFGQLNGFVYGHFVWHFFFVAEKQFKKPDSQNISVHGGNLIQWPFRSRLFYYAVYLFLFFDNASYESFHENGAFKTGGELLHVAFFDCVFFFFFRKFLLFGFSLFFVQFGQDVNNLPSFIFPAIKTNRVGQSLSSAFLASHKLRRFHRVMRPSVPRMRTGASHSYYHIICNYTRLSFIRKTLYSYPYEVTF